MCQVNILAVSHHQEVSHVNIGEEMTEAFKMTTFNLNNLGMERTNVNTSTTAIKTGHVNAILYWFVQDFGWGLTLNTLESSGYSQAAFLVKDTLVQEGSQMSVNCQFEKGLIQLSVTWMWKFWIIPSNTYIEHKHVVYFSRRTLHDHAWLQNAGALFAFPLRQMWHVVRVVQSLWISCSYVPESRHVSHNISESIL